MQMLKMLKEFRDSRDEFMDKDQLKETLEDLKREQSDLEYEQNLMNREYERKNQTESEGKSASLDKGLDKYSGKRLKLKY